MKQEDRLKKKVGNRLPYQVPEDYFNTFKSEMMSNLPAYPVKPETADISLWQKIRPYIYLAAMFAGIWCMMKIFHNASSGLDMPGQSALADESALIVEANDPYDYLAYSDVNAQFELEEEVSEFYTSIDEFKKDFYSVNTD